MSSHGAYEEGWPKRLPWSAAPHGTEIVLFSDAERLRNALIAAEDSRDGWERRYRAQLAECRRLVGELNLTNSALTSARAALNPEPVSTPQGEDEGG